MAANLKTMQISSKDVKNFMDSFDSPIEVLTALEDKTKELAKDIDALIHSMANLFEQDVLAYSMADVCIKVEMQGLGQTILKSQIGNPGLLRHIAEDMAKAEAEAETKEVENGI